MIKLYKIFFIGIIFILVYGIGYSQFKIGDKLLPKKVLKGTSQKNKNWQKKSLRTLNEYLCAIVDELPQDSNLTVLYNDRYGFAVGTNTYRDKQKANFYDLSLVTDYTELTDVIFSAYVDVPDSSKAVNVRVFDGTSGSPGTQLGVAPVTLRQLADSFAAQSYVRVEFASPIPLPASKKIFISVDFSNLSILTGSDEYFGLISTGFGMPYNLAWEQWDDDSWHSFEEDINGWNDSVVIEMYPVICGDIVVPVKLDKFSATTFGTANKLEWTTQTEAGNKGFEIQRSQDGTNFTSIGFVPSKANAGNSTSTISYTYVDEAPLAGNNFYRVKQVDINSRSSFTKTLLLTRDKSVKTNILAFYPNPVKNTLNLQLVATEGNATLTVTNITGVALLHKNIQASGANQAVQLDVSLLPKGTYFVKINGTTNVTKFIKN